MILICSNGALKENLIEVQSYDLRCEAKCIVCNKENVKFDSTKMISLRFLNKIVHCNIKWYTLVIIREYAVSERIVILFHAVRLYKVDNKLKFSLNSEGGY